MRIIYVYLCDLCVKTHRVQEAEAYQRKAEEYTRNLDPNPKNKGKVDVPFGTIIWPSAFHAGDEGYEMTIPDQRYKPDYRRNTAIQLCKRAGELLDAGKYEEALQSYGNANAELLKIYEDGKTGKLYDLNGIPNEEEARQKISSECLRDLVVYPARNQSKEG